MFLVAWLSSVQDCPLGGGLLPDQLKAFVCKKETKIEWEYTSFRDVAEKRVRKEGPGATVLFLEISKGKALKKSVDWIQNLAIEK